MAAAFFLLLCAGALMLDLRSFPGRSRSAPAPTLNEELSAVILGLGGAPFVEARGLFTIVPPAGWQMQLPPDCAPYDVAFFSPHQASMGLMATPVEYDDLRSLFAEIEEKEKAYDLRTHMETVRLGERMVICRTARLTTQQIRSIDFVEHRVAYHIMCSAPPENFTKYLPVWEEILKTFQPVRPPDPTESPSGR